MTDYSFEQTLKRGRESQRQIERERYGDRRKTNSETDTKRDTAERQRDTQMEDRDTQTHIDAGET